MARGLRIVVLGLCVASIMTLRADAQQDSSNGITKEQQVTQLTKEIQGLSQQLEPLRKQMQQLMLQVNGLRGQMRSIQEKMKADLDQIQSLRPKPDAH